MHVTEMYLQKIGWDCSFKRPCITPSPPKILTFQRPFKNENAIGPYCTQEILMIHKKEELLPFFANKALNKNRVDGRVQRMCVVIFKAVKSNTFWLFFLKLIYSEKTWTLW